MYKLTTVNNCAKFHLVCTNNKKGTVGGGGRNHPLPPQAESAQKSLG